MGAERFVAGIPVKEMTILCEHKVLAQIPGKSCYFGIFKIGVVSFSQIWNYELLSKEKLIENFITEPKLL